MNRCADVVCACILLVVTAPLMAAVALAIKLDSTGPITCRVEGIWIDGQRRAGLLKFRTTSYCASSIARGAPQTYVGRYLYLTRLDELPVLFDVLRGDLSIFGALTRTVSMSKRRD